MENPAACHRACLTTELRSLGFPQPLGSCDLSFPLHHAVRMTHSKPSSPAAKLLPALLLVLGVLTYLFFPGDSYQALKGLHGPAEATPPLASPAESLASWRRFSTGGTSRLAVLLTDPNSAWMGVQQALETMGIPYILTDDVAQATQHRVVLVYPIISGKFLNRDQQEGLRRHVSDGGCLLATQVLGADLKDLFGFTQVEETREHYEVNFDPANTAIPTWLTHERERTVRLGNPQRPHTWIGTQHYLGTDQILATYQDGKAAWIAKDHPGGGKAMALGFDLGFFILKCQADRDDEASRSYVNDYEPSVDVWLRLLRNLYQKHEPLAVTVDTVPEGQRLAAVMTFDIDYVKSMPNMVAYRDLLKTNQVPATFFIQAKYYRDYNDSGFFNDESVSLLRSMQESGIEIASHSVAHSDMFARLPVGTGSEVYPEYQPRVFNKGDTRNASVMGELRVSKYLLEKVVGTSVRSFRPGYLACPPTLPQAMEAAGYRYSSSVTGASVMTYLPFRKLYNREYSGSTGVYEFPVTVEDEHKPLMDERVDSAVRLAEKLAEYGGTFNVLSHPNVLDYKYRFFEKILPRLKNLAWMGTISQFGDWWSAREQLEIDVARRDQHILVAISAPQPVKGITLHLPASWKPAAALPEGSKLETGRLYLPQIENSILLTFSEG